MLLRLRRFFGMSDGVRRADGFWRHDWVTIQSRSHKSYVVPRGDDEGARPATWDEVNAARDDGR